MAAVTLATLKDPKPVVGEAHVRGQRWYLQGSIEQEVAIEIVKLLKDMMKVKILTCIHMHVHVYIWYWLVMRSYIVTDMVCLC